MLNLLRETRSPKRRARKTLEQLRQELVKKLAADEQGSENPSVGPLTEAERATLTAGGFRLDKAPPRKGRSEFEQLVADSLSVEKVAERLGVNASRIRQRLKEGTLYGFKHERYWELPRFQFSGRSVVTGLGEILPSVKDLALHPVAILRWFSTPQPELSIDDGEPMTPLDWLREGHPADAVLTVLHMLDG